MTTGDVILALIAVAIYNLYWRWLSPEERFIRRNGLVPASHVGTRR